MPPIRMISKIVTAQMTIIGIVSGIIALSSPASAGGFNVFSLFKKKKPAPPTVIAPAVSADLKKEDAFPTVDKSLPAKIRCEKMRVEGKPPNVRFYADEISGSSYKAFVVRGLPDGHTIGLINDTDKFRFDFWQLDPESLAPVQIIKTGALDPRKDEWTGFCLIKAASLRNGQLLIAVKYWSPSPRAAIYLFDTAGMYLKWSAQVENRTYGDLIHYFEYNILPDDTALVMYYTDQHRTAAEFYHNYLNHIMLFSPDYPNGLEVLRLSIDVGNIHEWGMVGKTMYLHTIDTRDYPKPTRVGNWSIDLSRLLR